MKITKVAAASFLMKLGALILFSQAISFARWSQWSPVSHFVNFHAGLLAVAGFSLLCALVIIRSLIARIEKLETVVAGSNDQSPPAAGG